MPANVYSSVVFVFSMHDLRYFIKYLSSSRVYFDVGKLSIGDFGVFCLNRRVLKNNSFHCWFTPREYSAKGFVIELELRILCH